MVDDDDEDDDETTFTLVFEGTDDGVVGMAVGESISFP
jgi:hypothetical protein